MASLAFYSFKAKSVMEYGNSLHMSITFVGIIMCFLLVAMKIEDIFELTAKFDAFFQTSTRNFS